MTDPARGALRNAEQGATGTAAAPSGRTVDLAVVLVEDDLVLRKLQERYAVLNATISPPLLAASIEMNQIRARLNRAGADIDWGLCEQWRHHLGIPETPFNRRRPPPKVNFPTPEQGSRLGRLIDWLGEYGFEKIERAQPVLGTYQPSIATREVYAWLAGPENSILQLFDEFCPIAQLLFVIADRAFTQNEISWASGSNAFHRDVALFQDNGTAFLPRNDYAARLERDALGEYRAHIAALRRGTD